MEYQFPPVPNNILTVALVDNSVCPRCLGKLDYDSICETCFFDAIDLIEDV